jgi:hypothetical protein
MAKRKARSQIDNLIPDHKKSGIDPISLHAGAVQHAVEKLSMKATPWLQTSSRFEVYTRNYNPAKL